MKFLIATVWVVCATLFGASNSVLTAAQQVELLESVRQLKREVESLRGEIRTLRAETRKSESKGSGLKTEDLGGRAPSQASSEDEGSMGWMKSTMKGLMDQLKQVKEAQEKRNKELEQLEKELP